MNFPAAYVPNGNRFTSAPPTPTGYDADAQLKAFEQQISNGTMTNGANAYVQHFIPQTQQQSPFSIQNLQWNQKEPAGPTTSDEEFSPFGSVYKLGPVVNIIGNVRHCINDKKQHVYVTTDNMAYYDFTGAKKRQEMIDKGYPAYLINN